MLLQIDRKTIDREYHLRRKRECERMALEAANPAARHAHETLAAEHAKLAEGRG